MTASGCSTPPRAASNSADPAASASPPSCPAEQPAPASLPGVRPEHRRLEYWLKQLAPVVDLDEPLLSQRDVAAHNAALTAAGVDGPSRSDEPSSAQAAAPPLTRRAVLERAFALVAGGDDAPGRDGGGASGQPNTQLGAALLAPFGMRVVSRSDRGQRSGPLTIAIGALAGMGERQAIIDAAARRGVVLLHVGSGTMLYLGRDADGRAMVVHGPGEFIAPCGTGADKGDGQPFPETRFRVDGIRVMGLNLGQGSSQGSLLQRLTDLTLYAPTPGPELLGAVERRPAAPLTAPAPKLCPEQADVAMLVSPYRPASDRPVRLIVSSDRDLGSVRLVLDGPRGEQLEPELRALGGPPFGYWAELARPVVGSWTARIGEGNRLEGCLRFRVRERPVGRQAGQGAVWPAKRRWTLGTENLYATFVEQLFDYPPDEELTWKTLQELVSQRDKNILYDHLGQDEDQRLTLRPDCADLPYFLRAYFAWKLRLPFGYRKCNRGTSKRAPYCDREIFDHLADREEPDEVRSFAHFARRGVADGVHSGNGRTPPDDERTDYYPIPLSRAALRPGTVFADPYGHVLVVADWVPQGVGQYGVLLGADAQPDGTVGRRRFWRGSFLFSPDTRLAGAGFKAFRPLRSRGGRVRPLRNEDIDGRSGTIPFSKEQYEISADEFYDRVEALINPRPLDPQTLLRSLIDALDESVQRRVVSVQNGEDYKKEHARPIEMPRGHAIFETTGPWEDFSTPARDLRLLIAIDTVRGFPAAVERTPERFGLPPNLPVPVVAAQLRIAMTALLLERRVRYVRSDGSEQVLSLQDVVSRAGALEMAYNPADCVEVRWGAPESSAERETCQQRAPADQRKRMESYRQWFVDRRRPAR